MTKTIDSYILSFSPKEKAALQELRKTIHSVALFGEAIKYSMPAFTYHSKIVACIRMYKHHIGFYPYSSGIVSQFKKELKDFKTSPGAVQLPKDRKLPVAIIKKLVKARMKEIDGR